MISVSIKENNRNVTGKKEDSCIGYYKERDFLKNKLLKKKIII